ncbi:NAD(P)-dependent oxidoreductase [Fischerella thermalis]|jgi:3-hydroxyisobutyrate dehydrogenase|uniref:2-hydroxy-3-oxopropionate reductase n=3 Tax=Fischerella TaxID=1190 RepID=G6FR68_9CYAN|nr:NAD(P)-dependent oxidoreductase [Fischerella thermalis]PMB01666.1 NAD(P)-dependent oxidoreductase [Fischerella thermalis CCMEE 5196]PMB06424.1 NAD(P)-dependent oxidoreductase [Fischerella thermalis CCMEE 5273]EHC15942.1 2-hydroxy-3-oxopropionate reductase [Fischerella thermalis JSC-11]PLZ09969.1 hydroxyacid dehydrogenase [Fischerella thermalis WC119]PLZ10190.1 hydroxyacid dehydrogenase [Fischerella thermalis WC114]
MKVAFLGTGLMGLPMAQKLLEARVQLIAYNRTPEKLEPLKEIGAEIAEKPYQAINAADCVILMLTNAAAIYSVLLSDRSSQAVAGKSVIQMGTITPTESREIRDAVVAAGGEYLEAPVLGSIPEAQAGNLIVMVGAHQEQYKRHLELLKHFGPEPILVGSVGTAAALKLALNQLIASLTASFALSLSFVQRYGIDEDLFMYILRQSALYAPTFDKKLPRMLDSNYTNPNFPTKHLMKDTDFFIEEAKAASLNVSSIEGVRKILEMAMKMSFAHEDYSSIFSVIKSGEN